MQRGQNSHATENAGSDVRNGRANSPAAARPFSRDAHEPAHALRNQVESPRSAYGPVRPNPEIEQ